MKLIKAVATVAGLTGVSRIAGFVRDILTASIIGAGPVADAFFVALKLPNFFRRVTAEGAFSVAFVPLYSGKLEKEGEEAAGVFASRAFAVMLSALSVFTVLAMMAMPWVIYAIAPGFNEDAVRYDLAVELTRVTFPYLLLMSLTALFGGMLNAHDRFAPFAAMPIVFNLCLITALLLSGKFFETPGHGLAWGVFAAGILQVTLLFTILRRTKIKFSFVKPKMDKDIKKLLLLMAPGVVGAGVMHINLFADVIIASMLDTGSISYLYYSDRLHQLPLGIIGIAIGTALLPMLSRAIAAGRTDEAKELYTKALEVSFLFALPAAVGLFFASFPIVLTLFEHGAFTRDDSVWTTAVLTSYAVGIPAYVAVKVFSSAFWAKQDTLTPVIVSVLCTLLNIGLSIWLAFTLKLGVIGIAVGTATAGWFQFFMLGACLKKHEEASLTLDFFINLLKIVAACCLMAAYLKWAKGALFMIYASEIAPLKTEIMCLGVLVGGGAFIYAVAILGLGVIRIGELKKLFKRAPKKEAVK